jgi:UMF1 family MFS transporter
MGLFSFGYAEELTGSMRNSIVVLMVFFIISFVLLVWTLRGQRKLSIT